MPSISQPYISRISARGNRPVASPNLVLLIVCAGVVMASLDLFIVNVALPQMAGSLGATGLGGLSWVLNAYAIVYASLLVLFGRLADRYRREWGFLVGVAIFVAASAACAAATSLPMLIGFRVLQAAGAALLTPTSLGLILATFPPERRHSAVRTWTAVGGLAAALGPAVGGLLVAASWRWVFLVNVPVGVAALIAGWRLLPEVPGHQIPWPDWVSAVLITAGVGALTLGLVEGGTWGWGDPRTIGVLTLAVLLLGLFALRSARHDNPLVDRALFRVRSFTGASAVTILFSIAFGAMLLSRVLWAQDVWHWSALTTGVSIPPTAFATGSGVVNMLRQVGLAIGVALLIAVLGSPHSPAQVLAAYQRSWTVIAAIAFAGGIVGFLLLVRRPTPAAATTETPEAPTIPPTAANPATAYTAPGTPPAELLTATSDL